MMGQYLQLFILLLIGCTSQKRNSSIVIKGNIQNFPAKMIFLTDAFSSEIIDSSYIDQNSFEFKIKPDSLFTPHLVCLKFYMEEKRYVLSFRNPYINNTASTSFMLETGITLFDGQIDTLLHNTTNPLNITGQAETKVQLAYEHFGFSMNKSIDEQKRKMIVDNYVEIIDKYPYSHYLCWRLFEQKNVFTSEEILRMLSHFDDDVKVSRFGVGLRKYIENRFKPEEKMEDLVLLSSSGRYEKIYDSSATLNVIAFWATWCVPCIKEIPLLKEVQKRYKYNNIVVSSISLDTDFAEWKSYINKYKMNWKQYIVDKSNIDLIKYKYDFNSIPVIFIVDQKRNLVARINDYSADNKDKLIFLLTRFLHNK